jgi:hypothetical protein
MEKPKVGDKVAATKSVALIKAGDVLEVTYVRNIESKVADLHVAVKHDTDEISWSSNKIRPLTKLDKYLSEE